MCPALRIAVLRVNLKCAHPRPDEEDRKHRTKVYRVPGEDEGAHKLRDERLSSPVALHTATGRYRMKNIVVSKIVLMIAGLTPSTDAISVGSDMKKMEHITAVEPPCRPRRARYRMPAMTPASV